MVLAVVLTMSSPWASLWSSPWSSHVLTVVLTMVLAMVLTVVLTFSSPWSSPCPRHGPHCPQGILLRGRCSAGRGQGSRESRRVTASLWDSNAAGITRPGAGGWTAERGTSPRTAGQLNAGTGKKHGRAADTHVREHPGCRDGPGIAAAGLPSLRGAGAEHPSFLPSYPSLLPSRAGKEGNT